MSNPNSSDALFDFLLSIAFFAAIYSAIKVISEPRDAISNEGKKVLANPDHVRKLNAALDDYKENPGDYDGGLVFDLDNDFELISKKNTETTTQ